MLAKLNIFSQTTSGSGFNRNSIEFIYHMRRQLKHSKEKTGKREDKKVISSDCSVSVNSTNSSKDGNKMNSSKQQNKDQRMILKLNVVMKN